MITATKKTFEQAYADAVIPDMTNEQCHEACDIRQLHWHGERMPLAEASELYAKICGGYNNFEPDMLAKLALAFPDSGIEVTPARESSVAVYLHIPNGQRSEVEAFVNETFNADEIAFRTKLCVIQEGETELDGEALRIWWD